MHGGWGAWKVLSGEETSRQNPRSKQSESRSHTLTSEEKAGGLESGEFQSQGPGQSERGVCQAWTVTEQQL